MDRQVQITVGDEDYYLDLLFYLSALSRPDLAGRAKQDLDTASSGSRRGAPGPGPCSNSMPEISRFYGIVIVMYYNDHAPPHFHAKHGGHEITVRIMDGIVEGRFSQRALRLVLEWYSIHSVSLLEDWDLARAHRPLRPIDPLE